MNGYGNFMDRQRVSAQTHRRLLELETQKTTKRRGARTVTFGALAACAALILGLGGYALLPNPSAPVADQVTPPVVSLIDSKTFVAQGPGEDAKLMFPDVHGVDYADLSDQPEVAADIACPPGSFDVVLGREDILKVFWGPEGKPPVEHPKMDTGDFPLMLMNWAGYEIGGRAIYDGNGDLWQLNIYGEKGEDSFTLRAAPGHIPPTCIAQEGATLTQVIDTQVKGWYRSHDRDGDGEVEHMCTSELIAHGVGVRFENIGAGGMRAGVNEANDRDGAILFNAMFVTRMCHTDGGLYLGHIAHTDAIPAWRNEKFETLDQARGEAAFAPYLPLAEPVGFGIYTGFKDFEGRLSYQEGVENSLSVRWSRGYDDITVTVRLPEGDSTDYLVEALVDVDVPESYDWRLYDGPICDVVPEEYQMDFYKPTFRAKDMSLEVVKARGHAKDTGGMAYRFSVLHEDGAVVSYDCSGVDADYVWSLVEATL